MCGIIAYCGQEQAQDILLQGLHKLEYRGYDSAGIACCPGRRQSSAAMAFAAVHKEVGRVEDLQRLCRDKPLRGQSGIGHCRWATHGAVTRANAHPHYSSDGQVLLAHNGIIENHRELHAFLEQQGFSFCSESDTETAANLLAYLLQADCQNCEPASTAAEHALLAESEPQDPILRAIRCLRHWLKGAYALAIMFAVRPDEIYAIRCESPLVAGLGPEGNYFASDILPILEHTQAVVYLSNHQIARLRIGANNTAEMDLYDAAARPLRAEVQHLELNAEAADKQGQPHFMIKEIHEQPRIFRHLFRLHTKAAESRGGEWLPHFDLSTKEQQQLRSCRQLIFVSCGTSYHASLYARYLLEKYARLPVQVEYASEFRYREPVLGPEVLVAALSQSGETADTLAALRLARTQGATTLALVNVPGSSIARLADILLCSHCGPEIGVASTKVYTAQLLILYYFSFYLAKLRQAPGLTPALISEKMQQSQQLAVFAERILSRSARLQELGRAYAGYRHILCLGRGLYYPLALEGALKLKELSYIHAEGYAAAEMKHGPIALIDSRMPVVVLLPDYGTLYEKMQSNIAEVRTRGARILAFVGRNDEGDAGQLPEHPAPADCADYNDVFALPRLSEELDVPLYAIALQLLAYHIALARGIDPDRPRNLAKSVTVE